MNRAADAVMLGGLVPGYSCTLVPEFLHQPPVHQGRVFRYPLRLVPWNLGSAKAALDCAAASLASL